MQTISIQTQQPKVDVFYAKPATSSTTTPCFFWAGEAMGSARRRPGNDKKPEVAYKIVQADLSVVPNPANGRVQVQRFLKDPSNLGKVAFSVVIVGSTGTQHGIVHFKGETGEMDLYGLAAGTYKLVDLSTGASTSLIVKQ